MKKLLLLTLLVSGGAWANKACDNPTNSFEAQKCLSEDVRKFKNELNIIYKKLYTQTEAKSELDTAQKLWLSYKEQQCGSFVAVDTGHSPAAVIMDLDCQSTLLQQRTAYLKTLLIE